MKLKDFLKKVDKGQFITVVVAVYGMAFETKHSAGFYLDHGDDLNDKEISVIYTKDDALCVRLED